MFCIFPLFMLLLYYIACNHRNGTMLLEKSTVIEQQQIVISEHEARTATLHATLNATNIALNAQTATLNATKIALETQKKITDQFKHSVSDLENVQRIFMGTKHALEISRNQLSKCKEAGIWERDVIQSKNEEIVLLKEQLNTVQPDAEQHRRHAMTEPQKDVVLLICVLFVILLVILVMMCCFCCKMKKKNDDLSIQNEKRGNDLKQQNEDIRRIQEERERKEKECNTQKQEWDLLLAKLVVAFVEEQDVIDDTRTEMEKADAIIHQIQRKMQELSAEIERRAVANRDEDDEKVVEVDVALMSDDDKLLQEALAASMADVDQGTDGKENHKSNSNNFNNEATEEMKMEVDDDNQMVEEEPAEEEVNLEDLLEPEPEKNDPNATAIRIRMPTGGVAQRYFKKDALVQQLYYWSTLSLDGRAVSLLQTMPRLRLDDQKEKTLKELGLIRATLVCSFAED